MEKINPYSASRINNFVDGRRYSEDALNYSELPRECPACKEKIKRSIKFRKSNSANRLTILAYLSFVVILIISILIQILLIHGFNLWLTLVVPALVFAGLVKAANIKPRIINLLCKKCGWEDSFFVR